jgi:hypothetical protein
MNERLALIDVWCGSFLCRKAAFKKVAPLRIRNGIIQKKSLTRRASKRP